MAWTNIQLYQKFASDKLFEKTKSVPLSHLVTFAKLYNELDEELLQEIGKVTGKVSEWRGHEQAMYTTSKDK